MKNVHLLGAPLCPQHTAFCVAEGLGRAVMIKEVVPELDGVLSILGVIVGREVPVLVVVEAFFAMDMEAS